MLTLEEICTSFPRHVLRSITFVRGTMLLKEAPSLVISEAPLRILWTINEKWWGEKASLPWQIEDKPKYYSHTNGRTKELGWCEDCLESTRKGVAGMCESWTRVWENNIESTDGEGQRPHQEVQLSTSTRYELAQVKQYNAIISLY